MKAVALGTVFGSKVRRKDVGDIFFWNPAAGIRDLNIQLFILRGNIHHYLIPLLTMADGIFKQIGKNPFNPLNICLHL